MDIKPNTAGAHRVDLSSRKTALITGVKDVRSFDEQGILIETEAEILVIRGSQLHVDRLTLEKGEVDIAGKIDSLIYTERKTFNGTKESMLKRLFG